MKQYMIITITLLVLTGVSFPAQASDWGTVGKVLTGITGMRLLSGGKVDIIGNIAGVDDNSHHSYTYTTVYDRHPHRHVSSCNKTWTPGYTWKKKWVPEHTEYDHRHGHVTVEGHYVTYKKEHGGSWSYSCDSGKNKNHHRNYSSRRKYGRSRWHR